MSVTIQSCFPYKENDFISSKVEGATYQEELRAFFESRID
jgi:hypothetical protein